ncbi:MAG: diguanylate cyclase [Desulfovibrionales bacterium]|nr:diguanylate cyclase [Desulfovibrionales bacterium]
MEQNFYQNLLDTITDGIYFIDTQKRITYWNKAAERLSGYTAEEVVGKSCADNLLRHVDDNGSTLCLNGCPLSASIADGKSRQANVYLHHKLGHRVPVQVQATPMFNASGNVIGAVEVFSENSESMDLRKEMEDLRREVLTDKLTNIGNRRYADLTAENLDRTMRLNSVPFGVLFIDIDDFKSVNDTWGHPVGDKILRMVAQSLASSLRFLDVVCRWGGEEFIVFVPNTTKDQLMKLAERLRMLIQNSWVIHEGNRIQVTASFGAAISRINESSADVIKRADVQLLGSKHAGRNCIQYCNATCVEEIIPR